MSTVTTWQTSSASSEQTEQLAQKLGAKLRGGEVIELVSDLGGGKTTFVRGLAKGAESTDAVASPSFTISKMYKTPKFEIHHFDFYRLHEAGIIADELAEVAGDPHTVAVIEWADVVQHVLPEDHVTIRFKQTPTGERELTFQYPKSLAYLMEELQ